MYMHGSYHISPQTFLRLIWQAWVHVHVYTRYDSVYAMYVHGDRWQEGCRSAGEGPARSWDSQESQGWLGLMESEVCLWSWTDVSVLCTYKHIHPCARMYLVHTTTYIHEHVCTWYIQVCKFMNMYIHVHECSEIHKHVHTVFRHVCTVLPYLVHVGRIPDHLDQIFKFGRARSAPRPARRRRSWSRLRVLSPLECFFVFLNINIPRIPTVTAVTHPETWLPGQGPHNSIYRDILSISRDLRKAHFS